MIKRFFSFRDYGLGAKLISAFLAVTLIPIAGLAYYNNISSSQNLTDAADEALKGVASETRQELDTFIQDQKDFVDTVSKLVIMTEYLSLSATDRAGSDFEAELLQTLSSVANHDAAITSVGLLDKTGKDVADTDKTEVGISKSDRDYFKGAVSSGLPYVSPIEFSRTTGKSSIYFSVPVKNVNGSLIGVLRIRYTSDVIQQLIKTNVDNFAHTGTFAVLFDENYIRLAHTSAPELILKSVVPLPADKLAQLQAAGRLPDGTAAELSTNLADVQQGLDNLAAQPIFSADFAASGKGLDQVAGLRLKNQPWTIVFIQAQEDFLAPVQAATRNNLIIAVVAAILVAAIGFFVALLISRPIVNLTAVAQKIAGGDFGVQAAVTSKDEVGTLAATFNDMTAQLTRRASDLATVAEVGTATSTILEVDKLLHDVVELTKERFRLYHSHIYLLDESGTNLVLTAGAGEPGRIMAAEKRSIPLDREQSLVARAARDRKGVTVNDVTQTPDFLPNPLLPDTRSELAVPLIAGGNVLGVFDVQSDSVGRFTDSDIAIQTTLAAQIASAVQNARQYEDTQSALSESERLFSASARLSQSTDLQELVAVSVEALKIPVVNRAILGVFSHDAAGELEGMTMAANWWNGVGHEATAVGTHYSMETLRVLSIFTSPTPVFFDDMLTDERVDATTRGLVERFNGRAIAGLPLFLGPRQIGVLALLAEEPHDFSQEDIRLFTALAPQIATLLENRRQYEQAQQQAKREAELNLITQKIQGATKIEAALQIAARELGHALGMKRTRVELEPAKAADDGQAKTQKENVS